MALATEFASRSVRNSCAPTSLRASSSSEGLVLPELTRAVAYSRRINSRSLFRRSRSTQESAIGSFLISVSRNSPGRRSNNQRVTWPENSGSKEETKSAGHPAGVFVTEANEGRTARFRRFDSNQLRPVCRSASPQQIQSRFPLVSSRSPLIAWALFQH